MKRRKRAPRNQKKNVDRFSDLPEDVLLHILSFLPTKLAARTSLLSPRFRGLWECCPALEIDIQDFEHLSCSALVDLADRALLRRKGNPPSPLHRLSLHLSRFYWYNEDLLTPSYISSLLAKAASLGLRHLTVQLDYKVLATVLPLILSFSSLESLSLDPLEGSYKKPLIFSPVMLSNLKTLSIFTFDLDSHGLHQLLPQLTALENLNLTWRSLDANYVELKCMTVKRLNLVLCCSDLVICAPSLEFFEFKSKGSGSLHGAFHGDMPLLKKAKLQFEFAFAHSVPFICQMLMAVSHVEELHIDIAEHESQKETFHALLVRSEDIPTFVNLKHFHLEICFHDSNIEDLVEIIQHSPALETLKLVHKPLDGAGKYKRKNLWRSLLPRNAEGNHRHAYFKDLRIVENRDELLRKLNRKLSSKKR